MRENMAELAKEDKIKFEKPNIEGDKVNIIVLIFMYVLQGALSGLNTGAFPIILQNRKVSYADQAQFSLTDYPFCFKLLWAPIVDCMYSKKFGRRKTWLIPTQYLVGVVFLWMSMNIDDLLGSADGVTRKPKISLLFVIFFVSMFFITVQDIALDGWSLTMLQRHNVGYAGFCQNVGGIIGAFISYVLIIILDSKDFSNKFRSVPKDYGFFSLSNYMFFWAIVWLVSATLLMLFKKEESSLEVAQTDENESRLGLIASYVQLWRILQVRPVAIISVIFLTCRIAFSPLDSIGNLKIIEAGVTRESFVLSTVPAIPIEIILSIVFRRSLTGPRAMHSFVVTYILRLIVGVVFTGALFLSSYLKDEENNKTLPLWYYLMLVILYNVSIIIRYLMMLSATAFFCRVSDPRYGGMYMTLMMTMMNLGFSWPSTLVLSCVDLLTVRTCVEDKIQMIVSCFTKLDGFYIESIILTALGILWICWSKKVVYELEKLNPTAWIAKQKKKAVEDETLPVIAINETIL